MRKEKERRRRKNEDGEWIRVERGRRIDEDGVKLMLFVYFWF